MKFGIGPDAHVWGKFKRRFRGDYVRQLHSYGLRCPVGSAYPFVPKAGEVALPKQADGGALDTS